MKEIWLQICEEYGILDRCLASSRDEASEIFKSRSKYEDWSESDILSEVDYLNKLELDALEVGMTDMESGIL